MFSTRLDAGGGPNALALAREARRASRLPILDLTETNPTRVGLVYDEAAILEALADATCLSYEPHPKGLQKAREAVSAYYADHQASVDPEDVFLTASTSEAYAFAMKLLADPGDAVLVPRPSYPLFDHLVALEGLDVTSYRLRFVEREGWRLDPSFEEAFTPRTRGLVAVSPNNPTGSLLLADELSSLDRAAARWDAALVVDEVFRDYRSPGAHPAADPLRGTESLTLVLSGLSKVAGLPQMKLGWIVVSGPEARRREAVRRLEFVADAYLSVSAPVMAAAPTLLALRHGIQNQIRARVESNEALLRTKLGTRVLLREGGWTAMIRLGEGTSDEETALGLVEREGVCVHPGYFYDCEDDLIVVSLLCPPNVFAEGVEAIRREIGHD